MSDPMVQVTKVEISKPFIKVTAKKIGGNTSLKLAKLQSLYEIVKPRKFSTGDKCIVRVTPRSYERGIVLVNNGQKASVYLTDCGCNGVFFTREMRHLIDEELSRLPPRCHEFIIAGYVTSHNAQLSCAWYRLRDVLMGQPMEIKKVDDDGNSFYIDLRIGDVSLVEDILKNDKILQREFEVIDMKDQKELMRQKQDKEPKNVIFSVTHNPKFYPREIPEQAEDVMITSYADGVNNFFIRKRSESDRCKHFVQKVNNFKDFVPYRSAKNASELKKLCLIIFLNRTYRGRIVQVEGAGLQANMIRVHLLETGEIVSVAVNKVFQIPDHLATEPPFGKQYKLESFTSRYNLSEAQINFYFKTLTFKKLLDFVLEDSNDTRAIPVCKLFIDGESIADKIACWDPSILEYKPQNPLQSDIKYTVAVSMGTSPSEFYVNIVEDIFEVNKTIKELEKFGLSKLKSFSENTACLVRHNSNFYRGKILTKATSGIWQVELVDLPFIDDFGTEEIFTTCEKLVENPPLAYKCVLKGFEDQIAVSENEKKFKEEVEQNTTFELTVSGEDKNQWIVELFDDNEVNLYDLIETPAEAEEEEPSDWSQSTSRNIFAQQAMVNMNDSVHMKTLTNENKNSSNWEESTLINMNDDHESSKSSGKSSKSSLKTTEATSSGSCTSYATTEWTNDNDCEYRQPSPSKRGNENFDTHSQGTSTASSGVSTIGGISLEPELVQITAVSSVDDFTVQKVSQAQEYEKFRTEVNKIAQQQPRLESYEKGALCLAFYDLSDQWCRAVIVEVENEVLFTMRNVDDGESFGVTDKDDLKQIPLKLQSTAFFGLRCSLTVAANQKRLNEAFQRLVRLVNQKVQCKIIVEHKNVHYVEIVANEKNLADSFISNGLGRKMQVMPPGKVNVVHIESLDDFAVRHHSSVKNFENVCEALKCVEVKDVNDPKVGMLVLAKLPLDKSMQRAKISSMEDGKFKVYFIDFGCFGVVDKVNALEANLATIPDTAVVCTLALPSALKPSNYDVQKFKKIVEKEKKKTIRVEMVEPGESKVEINLFIDGINVIERILPKKSQKIDDEIMKVFFD